MRILLDTNILGRLAQPDHAQHPTARHAVDTLNLADHELRLVPQIIYEFWAISTRGVNENGCGLTHDEAAFHITRFKGLFPPLRDERGILEHWEKLVHDYKVKGKSTHDARIAAAMNRHDITHLLTFNIADFRRFSGVQTLDPETI